MVRQSDGTLSTAQPPEDALSWLYPFWRKAEECRNQPPCPKNCVQNSDILEHAIENMMTGYII